MQGTHQLAKILSRCGCPVARSRELSAALVSSPGPRSNAGTALPVSFEGTLLSVGVAKRHTNAVMIRSNSANGAKRIVRLMRSASCPIRGLAHGGDAIATICRQARAHPLK